MEAEADPVAEWTAIEMCVFEFDADAQQLRVTIPGRFWAATGTFAGDFVDGERYDV
jgi:hypothetical protein